MEADLPLFELRWPGPMRDALAAATLSGAKTVTSSLRATYGLENEPLPFAEKRCILVGSKGEHLALVETTEVREVRLKDVDDAIAQGEGEGFKNVQEWRSAHEQFWRDELRTVPGGESVRLTDDSFVVVET
jgi:uncharacterized protein YhfF